MFHTYRALSQDQSQLSAIFTRPGASFVERVIAKEGRVVRVQTERRDGLVFMRAKKRIIYQGLKRPAFDNREYF